MADWTIPSKARMDEIFASVKNWGRWGADDEAGALNLITDEVRRGLGLFPIGALSGHSRRDGP